LFKNKKLGYSYTGWVKVSRQGMTVTRGERVFLNG